MGQPRKRPLTAILVFVEATMFQPLFEIYQGYLYSTGGVTFPKQATHYVSRFSTTEQFYICIYKKRCKYYKYWRYSLIVGNGHGVGVTLNSAILQCFKDCRL